MSKIMLSKNFSLDEFECPCCGGVFTLSPRLVPKLQQLRDLLSAYYGKELSVIITSGTRCPAHHAKIYQEMGKPVIWSSRHLRGMAGDTALKCEGEIIRWTDDMLDIARGLFNGIGIPADRSWLHVDVRRDQHRANWCY